MIILSCNNLNKSFGVDSILENVSFTINEGDKVGIVGVNGTGKTTLFKIISGEYGYDSGDIYTSKDCEVGYLEQNTNFYSENTILEEVLEVFKPLIEMEENLRQLEIKIAEEGSKSDSKILDKLMDEYSHKMELFSANNGYGYKSEAKGVLIGLGFKDSDFDKKVDILSGGEKTRVLLGKLLLKKPTLLLLDEPTNHLDSEAIEWLEFFLKQYRGTVMLISHDRYFLDQVVNRTFEIYNKKLKTYNGNYSDFIEQSKVEKELELLDTPGVLWPKFEEKRVGYNLAVTGAIKDTILHLDDIILYALDYLIAHYPDRLVERYNLSGQFEDKVAVLDEIGQKRGFLQSGGYVDYDKVYEILLREIRSVKLGRLSFELPSDIPTSEEK